MSTKYFFIDGGCLRAVLSRYSKQFFDDEDLPFNFHALTYGFEKSFYYDAVPDTLSPNLTAADRTLAEEIRKRHDRLRSVPGMHVYEGDLRRQRGGRRGQKKVDTLIAIDMLTHSFRGNMDRAALLASDLDFEPLINALVQNGMYVTLYFPSDETNSELPNAADERYLLSLHAIHSLLDRDFRSANPWPNIMSFQPTHFHEHGFNHEWRDESGRVVWFVRKNDEFPYHFAFKRESVGDFRCVSSDNKRMVTVVLKEEYQITLPPGFRFGETY